MSRILAKLRLFVIASSKREICFPYHRQTADSSPLRFSERQDQGGTVPKTKPMMDVLEMEPNFRGQRSRSHKMGSAECGQKVIQRDFVGYVDAG